MKKTWFRIAIAALTFVPAFAEANSGDFSGGVAIGTGYAAVNTAPTNGLIVQGNVGIGTSNPAYQLDLRGGGGGPAFPVNIETNATLSGIGIGNDGGREAALNFYYNGTIVGTYNYDNNDGFLTLGAPAGATSGLDIATYSTTPILFLTGSSTGIERMRITPSGTVGIGTPAPRGGSTLDVNGEIYVATFASGSSTTVCQNGNVLSSCTSAVRFKQNVESAHFGLNEVLQMKPVTFDQRNHKDNWEKHDFGFVAEDMEKINPLFVTYDTGGTVNGVRYMQLTAVNTKAIQEMQAEIDDLKQTIKELKHQQ